MEGDKLKCILCKNIFFSGYPDNVIQNCPYCKSCHYINMTKGERENLSDNEKTYKDILRYRISKKELPFYDSHRFEYQIRMDKRKETKERYKKEEKIRKKRRKKNGRRRKK